MISWNVGVTRRTGVYPNSLSPSPRLSSAGEIKQAAQSGTRAVAGLLRFSESFGGNRSVRNT